MKAMEDAASLRYIILERQSMIDSIWSRVEKTLELKWKVQQLEKSLQHCKHEVADLQAKVVQLNGHCRESFQEAQDMRFELSRHRFSGHIGSRPIDRWR